MTKYDEDGAAIPRFRVHDVTCNGSQGPCDLCESEQDEDVVYESDRFDVSDEVA